MVQYMPSIVFFISLFFYNPLPGVDSVENKICNCIVVTNILLGIKENIK